MSKYTRGDTVRVEDLANAIWGAMEEFKDATAYDVSIATQRAAKETAQKINSNASALFKGNRYSKSWKAKENKTGATRKAHVFGWVVYSPTRYRVAHLLEKGHAKVNGGRVAGRPHIAPAADEAETKLVNYIREEMQK